MNLCCFVALRGSEEEKIDHSSGSAEEIITNNVRLFSYGMLRSATKNFHRSNRLGGGGFGVVHKGVLRDGTQVAIKSLSADSDQGSREFLTEIEVISNVRHPNLVQLIGCCTEGNNRILVYEYLENNSLASALLGPKSKIALDWPKRVTVIKGTAQGLAFLHEEAEPHIVHRDIKASNILLGRDLNPKIGDFGLARLFPSYVSHVSTRVAGTVGYLAPEYALSGQLTKKADVYSFGVLLLEVISGRSNSTSAWGADMMLLIDWTWKLREEGKLLDIADPELANYPDDEVMRFIKLALLCTQAVSHQRPSMRQVVEMLSNETTLFDKLLAKPGVYKSTSPQVPKGKKSKIPFMKSTRLSTSVELNTESDAAKVSNKNCGSDRLS